MPRLGSESMKPENLALPQILECLLLKAVLLNRYDAAISLCADEFETVECASEGNHGAVGEGDRIGQTLKLPFEPVRVPGEKGVCILNPAPVRQGQNRGALRMADLEGKSLRPGRPAQRNIASCFRNPEDGALLKGNDGSC